jgi:hypothetical protein
LGFGNFVKNVFVWGILGKYVTGFVFLLILVKTLHNVLIFSLFLLHCSLAKTKPQRKSIKCLLKIMLPGA